MSTSREAQYFGRNFVWWGSGFQITTALLLTGSRTLTSQDQRMVRLNPTAGGFTVKFPAAPAPGDTFTFKEVGNSANPVILDGNGHTVELASSYAMNVARRARTFRYSHTAGDWEAIAGVN